MGIDPTEQRTVTLTFDILPDVILLKHVSFNGLVYYASLIKTGPQQMVSTRDPINGGAEPYNITVAEKSVTFTMSYTTNYYKAIWFKK